MDICIEKIQTAYHRAAKAIGGNISEDCPKFRAEFSHQLKKVVVEHHLSQSPHVERVGVSEDGEIIWSTTTVPAVV